MTERDNDLDRIFNESLSRLNKLSAESTTDLSSVSFGTDKAPKAPITESEKAETPAPAPTADSVKPEEISQPESDAPTERLPQDSDEESYIEDKTQQTTVEAEALNVAFDDGIEDTHDDSINEQESDDGEMPDGEYDEDFDEEPDGDYDDEGEFVEDYTDVSNRQRLQFNMNDEPEKKKRKRKKKKVKPNNSILVGTLVTVIVIAVSFILSFLAIQLGVEYMGFSKSEESITFEIPNGTTTDTVGDLLYQKGIINNPTLFKFVMKLQKINDSMIYPGEITLSPNMTYPSIIDAFTVSRKVYETVTVTFTEGISLYKAGKLLEENGVCSSADFLEAFNKNSGFDFEEGLALSEQTLYKMEGFFFPDTYEFYKESDAESVVSKIKTNFDNKMSDEVMALVEQSGLSLYDVITLASIVQAEADTKENMELVASVFLNRLAFTEEFPHLQSDATYFYVRNTISSAMGGMDKVSQYEYLYDTYSCFGLPVGAIGNPGMDAIMAVLKPAQTNYTYFVTDSKTGEFYYAETLEEHNENCKKAGY